MLSLLENLLTHFFIEVWNETRDRLYNAVHATKFFELFSQCIVNVEEISLEILSSAEENLSGHY